LSKTLIIHCTVPSQELAKEIAHNLVSENLAACVQQLGPITSTYRWENKIQEDQEWLLLIKTNQTQYQTIETYLQKTHPYEVPEIIAIPITEGSESYLKWSVSIPFSLFFLSVFKIN